MWRDTTIKGVPSASTSRDHNSQCRLLHVSYVMQEIHTVLSVLPRDEFVIDSSSVPLPLQYSVWQTVYTRWSCFLPSQHRAVMESQLQTEQQYVCRLLWCLHKTDQAVWMPTVIMPIFRGMHETKRGIRPGVCLFHASIGYTMQSGIVPTVWWKQWSIVLCSL